MLPHAPSEYIYEPRQRGMGVCKGESVTMDEAGRNEAGQKGQSVQEAVMASLIVRLEEVMVCGVATTPLTFPSVAGTRGC